MLASFVYLVPNVYQIMRAAKAVSRVDLMHVEDEIIRNHGSQWVYFSIFGSLFAQLT